MSRVVWPSCRVWPEEASTCETEGKLIIQRVFLNFVYPKHTQLTSLSTLEPDFVIPRVHLHFINICNDVPNMKEMHSKLFMGVIQS